MISFLLWPCYVTYGGRVIPLVDKILLCANRTLTLRHLQHWVVNVKPPCEEIQWRKLQVHLGCLSPCYLQLFQPKFLVRIWTWSITVMRNSRSAIKFLVVVFSVDNLPPPSVDAWVDFYLYVRLFMPGQENKPSRPSEEAEAYNWWQRSEERRVGKEC